MSADEKYNGWTNYATWRVNLEIVSDYMDSLDRDGDLPTFNDVGELARHLDEEVDEIVSGFGELDSNGTADLALSYARAFLSDVDWYDIAEHYIADFPQLLAPDSDPTDA